MNIKQTTKVFVLALGLLILPLLASTFITQPASAYRCASVGGLPLTYKDGACYLPATEKTGGKDTKIETEKPVHNDGTPIKDWECASGFTYNASKHSCEKCSAFGNCQADATVLPKPKGEDKTELSIGEGEGLGATKKKAVDDSGKNRSKSGSCAGEKTDYFACSGDGVTAIVGIVKIIVLIVSVGVGIVAVGGLVYGAILYASAQDSQDQISKSIKVIRSVITGLLLYMFMVAIINFLVPGGVFSAPATRKVETKSATSIDGKATTKDINTKTETKKSGGSFFDIFTGGNKNKETETK